MQISDYEGLFEKKIIEVCQNSNSENDPAHDISHFKRVVAMGKEIASRENANLEVVIPALWLHDFVNVPKDSPLRSQGSKLSAKEAINYLASINYPKKYFDDIFHAIEGHSFSANIELKTLEAKVVQGADRLDSLGAIGIARCFVVSGLMKTKLYDTNDPFAINRPLNDQNNCLDHFFVKILKIVDSLNTKTAKTEGKKRVLVIKNFLSSLKEEILLNNHSS